MKNQYIVISAITCALLTACAGQPKNGVNETANNNGKICRYEKTTGTHIGTKICRTPQQVEAEKEAANKAMRTLQRGQVNTQK